MGEKYSIMPKPRDLGYKNQSSCLISSMFSTANQEGEQIIASNIRHTNHDMF